MYDGWKRNLYVVWFATFASLTGGSLVQPFLPLFINRDLGIDDPAMAAVWFGVATGSSGIAMAIMSPIWGVLADRHGRKAMLVRAQFAIGAANGLLSFVGSPWQLVGLRAVQGMFSGVVGASRALVAGSVPRERVPYAMGVIQSAIFMGQTVGPTIGGLLASTIGFRAAFFTTAAINVVAGTLAFLYVKEIAGERGAGGRRGGQRASLSDLLRSRPLTLLVLMFFVTSVGNMVSRPLLPLLLQEIDPLHDVAFTSGLAFSVLGVSGTISSVLSGRAQRIGLRQVVLLSATASGVTTYLVGQAQSPEMVLLGLFFSGFAQGSLAAASTALISLFAPASRQGTAFGILTSAQSLAMGLGPLSGGLIASAFGLRMPFSASCALLVAGAALVMLVPRPPTFTDTESETERAAT